MLSEILYTLVKAYLEPLLISLCKNGKEQATLSTYITKAMFLANCTMALANDEDSNRSSEHSSAQMVFAVLILGGVLSFVVVFTLTTFICSKHKLKARKKMKKEQQKVTRIVKLKGKCF